MEVILTLGYCSLFFYIISRGHFFRVAPFPAWLAGVFFILKCLSGILLGLIYTKFYTNHNDTDTFKFFTDSKIMFDALFTRPVDFIKMFTGIDGKAPELFPYYIKMNSWLNTNTLFNDNKTIIRLNALFRFFSLGYYNVHVVLINFISFTGLFCLYKTFSSYCPDKKKELLLTTFLLPSVMFWGSGLLKDGILIAGFGLFIYSFTLLLKKGFTIKRLLFFLTGFIILMFTKVYVIIIILPGMLAWLLTYRSSGRKVILTFISIYGIYLVTAFSLYHVNPDYNVAALLYYKQKNFIEISNQHSASAIAAPGFICSAPSILKYSPIAFCNTMFRPFLSDAHGNPMILLSALENLLIIFLFLICLISFKRKNTDAFVMFSLFFIVLLFILIGLITPVLGAIVRYRIIALPSLLFLLTYYYNSETLKKRLQFLSGKNKTGST